MKFLCALEAVNLDTLFSDCQDLSTVRGGGLAVLDIAGAVAAQMRLPDADVITRGASQGFLRIEGTDAAGVEAEVRHALTASDPWLGHATIVVAACPEVPAEFSRQRAELKAKMRWAQMQSPSVVYPTLLAKQVCAIDKVRPARGRHSDFTEGRRNLGRVKKKKLLEDLLTSTGIEVVQDLEELADHQEGNLLLKIAVFRFDGNDFGKLAQDCQSSGDFQKFSLDVQTEQQKFFRRLLLDERGVVRPEWITPAGKMRLEIVVYGGDEVSFITPAELGWKALQVFYECAEEWPPTEPVKPKDPKTYAGGLVFCHHKAPIHAIKKLAGELADWAKEQGKKHRGGKGNDVAYQVLESFDDIGQDLEDFLAERYGSIGHQALLRLPQIRAIQEGIDQWRSHLAKRKLHDLVDRVLSGAAKDLSFDQAARPLLEAKPKSAENILEQLRPLHAELGHALFVHLLELWDYAGLVAAGGQR